MTDAERLALEAYPVKYTSETWKRVQPDRNAPLRAAFIAGFNANTSHQKTQDNDKSEI